MTIESLPALAQAVERIEALEKRLSTERGREAAGEAPEVSTVSDVAARLRFELDSVRKAVAEMGDWEAPTPVLGAVHAVALEHLAIAGERVDAGLDSNPHALLHDLIDAAFHARRAGQELLRLQQETITESRRASREENRQEFMSG